MSRTEEAWREEISALRAEIEAMKQQKASAFGDLAAEGAARAQAAMDAAQKSLSDLIEQANDRISELQGRLSEGTEMAQETMSQHPFATMASAFLLGLVIGRLAR